MIHRGIATFGLDTGKCPRWLFERMVKLGRAIIEAVAVEYGPDECIARLGDPITKIAETEKRKIMGKLIR